MKKQNPLPQRLVSRTYVNKQGESWIGYYYRHPRDENGKRKATPLGSDLYEAKKKWAELEGRPTPVDTTTLDGIFSKYMEWANNRQESGLSIRTLTDRARYWKFLSPVYGQISVNAILPEHLLPYFHKRASKVSAKKELKFLSVIFNWARSRGYMKVPNPCAGLFVQMKVKERRDIYVEDTWLALVYKHADTIIKDCLDLAYITGQRPADVRKMRWDQIKDGALEIKQNKTKAKLRVAIEGDLADLLNRIKSRQGIKGFTILADPKGQPLKAFGYFRSHFDKARDAAEQEAKELGISFERFQFRDLRPKAASDIDAMHDIKAAQKLLGHTTEQMTAGYIRSRRGDVVQPMSRKVRAN